MATATAEKTNGQVKTNALVKKDVVDIVAARIRVLQEKNELHLPPNYSAENALKAAWLALQEVTDKDGRRALDVCDRTSIMNSLLKMVIQGLNPAKNQCYFVVFGTKLVLMRSYFGSIHVAKSVDERIEDIVADLVYEGDEFEYEKLRGKTRIITHKQKLENIEKAKIKAAYATVIYKDGRDESVIMTIDEIKQAWKQSNIHPIDDKGNIKLGTVHDKFMAEMAKKSVINRICKPIFNGSDDSNIVAWYARQTDGDLVEAEVEEEIAEKANQELIDVEVEAIDSEESEALPEPQKQAAQNKKQPDAQGTIFSPTGTEGPGF